MGPESDLYIYFPSTYDYFFMPCTPVATTQPHNLRFPISPSSIFIPFPVSVSLSSYPVFFLVSPFSVSLPSHTIPPSSPTLTLPPSFTPSPYKDEAVLCRPKANLRTGRRVSGRPDGGLI